MAEIAAGAWAAEEVATTAVQAGVAGYWVVKPTQPLKATFTMIASAEDDHTRRSLARSNHTLTVVSNKAFIFGGETADGNVASNDIHMVRLSQSEKGKAGPDYHLLPAMSSEDQSDDKVPKPRTKHAAVRFNGNVAIFGGCDESDELIDEDSSIWLFNPEKSTWKAVKAANSESVPGPRRNAKLFAQQNALILYGGKGAYGSTLSDVWQFNVDAETWTQFPTAPASTSNAALADSGLYLISGSDTMSSEIHHLTIPAASHDIEDAVWETFTFPANPIAPGPRARQGGGLLYVSTGFGRNYLVHFFGARENTVEHTVSSPAKTEFPAQWSDMWTFQLPSSDLEAKPRLSIGDAIKPAKIKDAIREKLGMDSGKSSWAEVEVQLPPADMDFPGGKLHPGPRAFFGCDIEQDGKTVVVWGGENAKGERVGDGWIVTLS